MFVDAPERIVVFQDPDGLIDSMPEGVYRAWRNELPDEQQGLVDAVYLRVELTVEQQAAIADSLGQLVVAGDEAGTVRLAVGGYALAVAEAAIDRWDGPSFGGRPVTPEVIGLLDTQESLVIAVFCALNAMHPLKDNVPLLVQRAAARRDEPAGEV